MENSERRLGASGKEIKCITKRLHNKPQHGAQAQTHCSGGKLSAHSMMVS